MSASATTNSNERLILFSDAIIAVTITLLALDIRLPDGESNLTEHQMLDQLIAMGPRIYAYALSFLVIGSFWIAHRRKFERITGSHATIIWLNFFFLLSLGLVPFATDVLAEKDGLVATILYALTVGLASFLLASIGLLAHRRGLIRREDEFDSVDRELIPSLGTAAIFIVSIPFAFINPDIAKLIWLLLIPFNIWLTRRRVRRGA
jgi:uncharacterized membrane protein